MDKRTCRAERAVSMQKARAEPHACSHTHRHSLDLHERSPTHRVPIAQVAYERRTAFVVLGGGTQCGCCFRAPPSWRVQPRCRGVQPRHPRHRGYRRLNRRPRRRAARQHPWTRARATGCARSRRACCRLSSRLSSRRGWCDHGARIYLRTTCSPHGSEVPPCACCPPSRYRKRQVSLTFHTSPLPRASQMPLRPTHNPCRCRRLIPSRAAPEPGCSACA